jgi:ubiquinone/menaquinone biosynthesis C-methylase UbiE
MQNDSNIKDLVRQKYAEIATQSKDQNTGSCCGSSPCSDEVYNIMTDDYSKIEGYTPEADLGLGCGLPTAFAKIKEGNTVIDLGSGAGNDVFIARKEVGETGKVIGIDFTPEMIEKAKGNAEILGYKNVSFISGDIEQMPVADNTADVIVSNCVLNLVPNKKAVFNEIYRVLKPSGHFSISDIVIEGILPPTIKEAAEMYAGCVSGAIAKSEYLNLINEAGFKNVTIQKEKPIIIPNDILSRYLNESEIADFNNGSNNIVSITVYAEKSNESKNCCGPDCCN